MEGENGLRACAFMTTPPVHVLVYSCPLWQLSLQRAPATSIAKGKPNASNQLPLFQTINKKVPGTTRFTSHTISAPDFF